MAYTRQEYYVDDDSYRSNIYSTDWECQTFTASEDYTLTKLSLKIGRMNAGTVENAVVSIRATDIVTGAPTGGDLAVATILVSDLIQSNDCRWEDFSFSLALTSGVKYAICLRPTSPTVGLVWRLNTNGTYAGGQRGRSTDSGVTWIVATYVSTDFAFQTYKDAVAYEGYDLSDATLGMYGSNWYAQTFLTISAHTVSAIMLNMARVGTVGICTASIRATDALTGQPTGPDLVSGTFDASDITLVTGGEDCIFYIDSPYELSDATTYAIVVRLAGGNSSNKVLLRMKTVGTYADGAKDFSNTSGVTWTGLTASDVEFQIWGNPTVIAPIITDQPDSATVDIGGTATFSITATGLPSPTYEWNKDGSPTPIPGETSDSLSFTVDENSGGDYTCTATNAGGSDTSNAAILSIIPLITAQSSDTITLLGQIAALGVTAVGTIPLTYQWYKNNIAISGETSASLSMYTTAASSGTYKCIVTNAVGSDTSADIVLTIIDNPYIWNPFNLTLDQERAD